MKNMKRLKKRLLAEGLFDDTRKRKIPSYAKKIGVVTAGTGQSYRIYAMSQRGEIRMCR